MNTPDSDWFKARLYGCLIAIAAAFCILAIRLFYLQIIQGKELRRLSENNCIRLKSILPYRGLIFDRNNQLMVDNRPSYDVYITLRDAKPVKETLTRLALHTGIDGAVLEERAYGDAHHVSYKPFLLIQDIDRDLLAVIEAHRLELPGIEVRVTPRRNYIHRKSASHLLGYLGEISAEELRSGKYPDTRGGEYVGKFGVEKRYETALRGKRGGRQVEVDARGRVVRVLKTVPATPGYNLVLTLDASLQRHAETLMEGRTGAVAAMDPMTGDVLVMVSAPSFDQNAFVSGMSETAWNALRNDPRRPMENKVIHAEYPPASIYKVITAMAGLEETIADGQMKINCPGYYRYGDRMFRCWTRWGHGAVTIEKSLAVSCDVYFYQLGQKLGVERLAWYARGGGFGSPTGIPLENESSGLVPTAAWKRRVYRQAWQGGETLNVSIGQGYNLATPLQALNLYAAIANGGTRYTPRIIRRIQTAEGEVVFENRPEVMGRLPVSAKNLKIVRQGLADAVAKKYGTARSSVKVDTVSISGKTGTAQVVSRRKTDRKNGGEIPLEFRPHAWFAGYAPTDSPEIAVVVLVEHGEHGSSTAGPIARALITRYLNGKNGANDRPGSVPDLSSEQTKDTEPHAQP
ncbi:MAG: penicillin-binding protein 2 [Deltaproteobacteria bacterium]|nr:MAG: penicillin-binding protein 2 [Deltaproteobacteria bacterium]